MTLVWVASKMEPAVLSMMSEETISSVLYSKDSEASFFIWALTWSAVKDPLMTASRIVVEPVATGTRWAAPFSLPLSSGITRPMAFAAPEDAGTMFSAAARERRRSPLRCGPSRTI